MTERDMLAWNIGCLETVILYVVGQECSGMLVQDNGEALDTKAVQDQLSFLLDGKLDLRVYPSTKPLNFPWSKISASTSLPVSLTSPSTRS